MSMNYDALAPLRQALNQTGEVIAGIRPEQLGLATPYRERSVRELIYHIIGSIDHAARRVLGEEVDLYSEPNLEAPDWPNAYKYACEALIAAFERPGALLNKYPTPFGPAAAGVLLNLITLEIVLHGWDLAKPTQQLEKLDDQLGETALILSQTTAPVDSVGSHMKTDKPFPVPLNANVYDRLAGSMGRHL